MPDTAVAPEIETIAPAGGDDFMAFLDEKIGPDGGPQEVHAVPAPEPTKAPEPKPEPVADVDPKPAASPDPEPKGELDDVFKDLPPGEKPEEDKWGELKNATPAASARWGELKSENKTLAKQVQELQEAMAAKEAEFQKAKPAPADTAEVERIRARNQELEDKIALLRVEESAEYQREVIAPMQKINQRLDVVVATHTSDPDEQKRMSREIQAILSNEPDRAARRRALREFATDMEPDLRLELMQASDALEDVLVRDSEIRARPKDALSEVEDRQRRESESQKEARQRALQDASQKVFDELIRRVPILRGEDGKPLPDVEQLRGAGVEETEQPATQVFRNYASVLLPKVLQLYGTKVQNLEAEVEELRGALASATSLTPGAGGGGGEVAPVQEEGGFLEAMMRASVS